MMIEPATSVRASLEDRHTLCAHYVGELFAFAIMRASGEEAGLVLAVLASERIALITHETERSWS